MRKNFARIAFTLACLLFSIVTKAQITVTIAETYVNNQLIGSSSPIAFGTNQTLNIKMVVDITAQNNQDPSKPGMLDILRTSSPAFTPVGATGTPATSVSINGTFASRTFTFTLNASDFDATQGIVFAEFTTYSGVKYKSANKNVTKTITPPITNNAISGNQSIYYGQSAATLTGNTPSGGSGTFSYIWNKKTGSGDWAAISGATGQNYSPGQLTTTTQFRRIANSGSAPSLASNTVTVTVNNSQPIANNVIAANQTINEGNPAAILTGSVPTGGSGANTYTYTWQKKTGTSAWAAISGATSQNYSPGTPFITTSYRRIVKSGNAADLTSNEITVTIIPAPPIQNNTISLNGGTVLGSLPTGGIGVYTYSWILWGGEEPYVFPNTTQSLVIPDFIYNYLNSYPNLFIVRTVSSGSQNSSSNTLAVLPLPAIQNNVISISGSQITGSLPTGGNGDYQYSWTLFGGEEPYTFPETTQNLAVSPAVYDYLNSYPNLFIFRTVKSGNRTSGSNTVVINPLPAIQNNTISASGFQVTGSQPTGGDGTYTYSWFLSSPEDPIVFPDTTKDINLASYTNAIWVMQNYPSAFLVRVVKSGNKTSNSNFLNIYAGRKAPSVGKEASEAIKVYPNPTTKTINFETNLGNDADVDVVVYSESGKSSSVFKGKLIQGQTIQWNIPSNYPKGLYFYKILSGKEEIKTGKILYQ